MVKIEKVNIHAESLENNKPGDPADREVLIISNNYEESSPLLIGIAGFYGTAASFLNRSYSSQDFISTLERISKQNPDVSYLMAIPDTMTSYCGNQYLNSSAVGNYEDFIVNDLIGFLMEKYGKRKTGIFGKSSGGFGAYTLTVRHPEVFSGFIDVSGDSLFEYCYLKDFPGAIEMFRDSEPGKFLQDFRSKGYHSNQELNAMEVIAMSAFYSPDTESPYDFVLPFDIESGKIRYDVWNRWLEVDPARTVVRSAPDLKGKKIILQVGKRDEFALNIGMSSMHRTLEAHGIEHSYQEYDTGHFSIDYLYQYSLPELARFLSGL